MGKNFQTLRDLYGFNHDFVLITLKLSEVRLNSNLGVMHSSEIRVGEFGIRTWYFSFPSPIQIKTLKEGRCKNMASC